MTKKDKKIIILLVFAALIGGILGSVTDISPVKANLFGDIYNDYLKPIFSPVSNIDIENFADEEKVSLYGPTVDYEEAVISAVESASPAVISIIISKDLPIIEQCPYNPFGDINIEGFQFYRPCEKGTELREIGGGSGFIISSDGLIATNKHVVSDSEALYTVLTNDGKKYDAQILALDPIQDLAVIKISASNLPVLPLGNSDSIKLGQTAIAIGNALGEFRNTVSLGVVSGLSRNIVASGGGTTERIEGLIQTDAAINSGNSGGPLLNLKGEVIGINVATVSGAQNIGFAIPINQVKKAIRSVEQTGRISTPYLGVRYEAADSGVLVSGGNGAPAIISGSPAEKAGIRGGDVILEINGEKITQDSSLSSILQKYAVGDSVELKISREGEEIFLKVILEERPQDL